jgi:hypothetical protein
VDKSSEKHSDLIIFLSLLKNLMGSRSLTKFLFDEGAPSNSPGWQKEVFVDFFRFKICDLFSVF